MDAEFWDGMKRFVEDEFSKIDMKEVAAKYREEHKAEIDAQQQALSCGRYICSMFGKPKRA